MASTSLASAAPGGGRNPGSSFNSASSTMSTRCVHAADIKNKTCWICSGDEDEDAAAVEAALMPGNFASSSSSSSSLSSSGASSSNERFRLDKSKRRFVHACGCTLVAHEAVGLPVHSWLCASTDPISIFTVPLDLDRTSPKQSKPTHALARHMPTMQSPLQAVRAETMGTTYPRGCRWRRRVGRAVHGCRYCAWHRPLC